MPDTITFDDKFVRDQLLDVATNFPALPGFVPHTGTLSSFVEDKTIELKDLYYQHRGMDPENITGEYKEEKQFLFHGLKILGSILNLGDLMGSFRSVIETDWKAHVELNKAKRYRDHICHPFRVTAVGWWLLHREDHELLKALAQYYEGEADQDY